MIIIKHDDDVILDVLAWLTQNVSPNSKPDLEPVWGSPYTKKVEWAAANHMWRVKLDDKAKEISISIMDVNKETELRKYLHNV